MTILGGFFISSLPTSPRGEVWHPPGVEVLKTHPRDVPFALLAAARATPLGWHQPGTE